MKRILFIDRDGTLIDEPKTDFQVDSFEKLIFLPGVFTQLARIIASGDYELVMVTNQDGLGTSSFPENTFWPVHNRMMETFKGEGIDFEEVLIDDSFESNPSPNRKPNTGLLKKYMNNPYYDLKNSFVIGDRSSDIQLAKNLGAKGIYMGDLDLDNDLLDSLSLSSKSWKEIADFLLASSRQASVKRKTKETDIEVWCDLDGSGDSNINTGLKFFDHMLDQIARHGLIDLRIEVKGDLEVDEHHTIEDTMICLGEVITKALGSKIGIERYGFALPMDDCYAQVLIDFGGRNWLEWDVEFKREFIGDMPTEMFFHAFKSFSDAARCNLNIKAEGQNEHHKIESIFKAFAKALKMAKNRDYKNMQLPSTKELL
jgi:imidazoleglycerol-phosphate dehydratase/histidinol-phosphatase